MEKSLSEQEKDHLYEQCTPLFEEFAAYGLSTPDEVHAGVSKLDALQAHAANNYITGAISEFLTPKAPDLWKTFVRLASRVILGKLRVPRRTDVLYFNEYLPKVLPSNWEQMSPSDGEAVFYKRNDGLVALISGHLSGGDTGVQWIHASISFPDRMPGWEDLVDAKELFIGRDIQALTLFPPRSKWVNIHPWCLHLWACVGPEGDGLPDFTLGSGSI